jgi:hypothetical protein
MSKDKSTTGTPGIPIRHESSHNRNSTNLRQNACSGQNQKDKQCRQQTAIMRENNPGGAQSWLFPAHDHRNRKRTTLAGDRLPDAEEE